MKLTDSQKINFLLEHFNLNVSQFAESLGVSKQSIRNIINGRNNLSKNLAKKIHEKYGVNYDWIRLGIGEMSPTPVNKSDRIAKVISELGLTVDEFCDQAGILNKAKFAEMINKRLQPSSEVLVRIINTYKTINPVWLIQGDGDMFRPTGEIRDTSTEKDEMIKLYRKQIELLEEKILNVKAENLMLKKKLLKNK